MAILSQITLTGSTFLDCLAIAALAYLYFGIRSYTKLSHVPGPKLWGWTLFPLMKTHLDGNIYNKFGELNEQYGPLVRISPKTLLTSDPDVLRRMNAARTPYTRANWYISMRMIPGKDNILSLLSDARHDDLRYKMAMGYSGKENLTLEGDIDECVLDLINLLKTKYMNKPGDESVKMDLAQKIQYFTSDIMSKISFDAKFGDLRDDNDNHGYVHEIETVFPKIFCTCVTPALLDFLTKIGLLGLLAPSDGSSFGFGKILAICKSQIAKRFDVEGKPINARKDMLGSFIRHGLTQREVEQEAVLQLGAGSDTTATGLRGTMLCLISNPGAYAKLQTEIHTAMKEGKISSDPAHVVTDEQARNLPYLQACIKEGIRWWPPVAGMLPKQTPPQGDTVCGYFVPGGIGIAYSAKAVHHSKELFGPDEYSYRPERWIHTSKGGDESSLDKITRMERNNELVFGNGKYQCLGKSVALVELNKVITELVKRFDMTLVNPDKPWETICFGVHFQKNFWVTVKNKGEGLMKDKVVIKQ